MRSNSRHVHVGRDVLGGLELGGWAGAVLPGPPAPRAHAAAVSLGLRRAGSGAVHPSLSGAVLRRGDPLLSRICRLSLSGSSSEGLSRRGHVHLPEIIRSHPRTLHSHS